MKRTVLGTILATMLAGGAVAGQTVVLRIELIVGDCEINIAEFQPLVGEVLDKPLGLRIAQHPLDLIVQDSRLV
jgi:hypothetical protein